jgi:hypothetical protein
VERAKISLKRFSVSAAPYMVVQFYYAASAVEAATKKYIRGLRWSGTAAPRAMALVE